MRMPAIFIGHGSPMNAIEHNQYTEEWDKIGQRYKPKAILMISGHWFTKGNLTQNETLPRKVNDMYGFPQELYTMTYPAHNSPHLVEEIFAALGEGVAIDNSWGLDHGAWSVLAHMYPEADIPVVQLSVDRTKSPKEQFEVGRQLAHLRDLGYMIIASGNVVHNFGEMNPSMTSPLPWTKAFDDHIEASIVAKDYDACINYLDFGTAARLSVPTTDHYYPLLYLLGAVVEEDHLSIFNKAFIFGSFSMTSYLFE